MNSEKNYVDKEIENASIATDTTGPIENSPYYRETANTLPDGSTVTPSGFYMRDDNGSIIYQLNNDQSSNPISGTINVDPRLGPHIASINGGQSISASSHMRDSTHGLTSVSLVDGFIITDMIDITGDRLAFRDFDPGGGLTVNTTVNGVKEQFFIYNVMSKNGQLSVIHEIKPETIEIGGVEKIVTKLHGMVYVEHKKPDQQLSHAYLGYLQNTTITLDKLPGFIPKTAQHSGPEA